MHASVLASTDPNRAWDSFREALDADLDDTQQGTTKAGIHLGAWPERSMLYSVASPGFGSAVTIWCLNRACPRGWVR